MLEAFKQYSAQHFPFLFTSKVLITVSAGIDSMVLLHLCESLHMDLGVAHCNFNLRGEESEADTKFIESYCSHKGITFFKKYFDTSAYAKTNKTSTQIAARELRYEWFEALSVAENFKYILTAHHVDDDLETFLINFGRGTGINGLTGIPAINRKVVRPLLTFSRMRIKEYALLNDVKWREDSSNATDDYQRNHLRHHAIPALLDAQPNLYKGFKHTKSHLQQTAQLANLYTLQLKEEFLVLKNGLQTIETKKILDHPAPKSVLFAILNEFGFTSWDDIYELLTAQSGKQVMSNTHRLLKDREVLLLLEIDTTATIVRTWHSSDKEIYGTFGKIAQEVVWDITTRSPREIYVDASLIHFPLRIRTWQEGDVFHPFGLVGKKKLSKYYKDEKLSLVAKEKTWLLCQGDDIIWVIGMRADDRFKITTATQNIIKFTLYDA